MDSNLHAFTTSEFNNLAEKTLIIVDTTPNETTLATFLELSTKYLVLDMNKLHWQKYLRNEKIEKILQEMKFIVSYAMQEGRLLVVRMGDVNIDFIGTFCDDCYDSQPNKKIHLQKKSNLYPYDEVKYFPVNSLLRGGRELTENPLLAKAIFQPLEGGVKGKASPTCKEGFGIILTTTIPEIELDSRFFGGEFGLPPKDNFLIRTWDH